MLYIRPFNEQFVMVYSTIAMLISSRGLTWIDISYHMFPFLFFFADYIIFLFKACQNIILTFYSLIKSLPPLIQDLNLIIYFASRSSLPRIKRHTYTYQNIYAKLSFCCILIRFTSVSDKHKIWVLFFTFSNF